MSHPLDGTTRIATARMGEVIWAQLEPDADLYLSILALCQREQIRSGVILNIVGALRKARLSLPVTPNDFEAAPGILELEGMMECQGVGTIGITRDTYDTAATTGIVYRAGEPNLHIHLTVTGAGFTHMGHLIEGCLVRSVHPVSHFTIVLARTEGALLQFGVSPETTPRYPHGIPIHELIQE